ncbi:18264_t:CDS:2 [Racocetra persica]|uniref:18264_t:CDS:1 n=1 Tax=Racocetra persica TaxID=160502 RepID=A0ACA9NF41_9GLOM|nr:18264_t:CDS:2 [Racocetra persica]
MSEKLSPEQVNEAFQKFDYNNNGILSLAEIDKAVIYLYPQFSDKKPVLMRAYKAADTSKDGYIERDEFPHLIELLYYFNEVYDLFQKLDKDKDKRVDFEEFKKGYKLLGITRLSNDQIKAEFDKIDTNHGGYILFDEFCIYAAKKKLVESKTSA